MADGRRLGAGRVGGVAGNRRVMGGGMDREQVREKVRGLMARRERLMNARAEISQRITKIEIEAGRLLQGICNEPVKFSGRD